MPWRELWPQQVGKFLLKSILGMTDRQTDGTDDMTSPWNQNQFQRNRQEEPICTHALNEWGYSLVTVLHSKVLAQWLNFFTQWPRRSLTQWLNFCALSNELTLQHCDQGISSFIQWFFFESAWWGFIYLHMALSIITPSEVVIDFLSCLKIQWNFRYCSLFPISQ